MRANGVPEHVIQELLGHKSPETTQTYMHITTEQFNATAKKMHSNSFYVDELLTEISQKNLSDEQLLEIKERIDAMLQKGAEGDNNCKMIEHDA